MKNIKIGKKSISTKEKTKFITNKIKSYQRMISNSIIYVQIYKSMNIFSRNRILGCRGRNLGLRTSPEVPGHKKAWGIRF